MLKIVYGEGKRWALFEWEEERGVQFKTKLMQETGVAACSNIRKMKFHFPGFS